MKKLYKALFGHYKFISAATSLFFRYTQFGL